MLEALCRGTTDPELLAELARGRLRKKLPQLKEALEGRFDPRHRLVVSAILAHLGTRRDLELGVPRRVIALQGEFRRPLHGTLTPTLVTSRGG